MENHADSIVKIKNKVLTASIKLFIEKGYDATTFSMIEEESQVDLDGITLFFKTKRQILSEMFDMFFKNYGKLLGECLEKVADPMEKLKLLIQYILLIEEKDKFMKSMNDFLAYKFQVTSETSDIFKKFIHLRRKQNEVLLSLIEECKEKKVIHIGDPVRLMLSITSFLDDISNYYAFRYGSQIEKSVDDIFNAIVGKLAN